MKTMKYILIVIGLVSILTAKASAWDDNTHEWGKQPEMCMHSTSTMRLSGTTLPQAAAYGATTTYGEEETMALGINTQKRARPGDWVEPGTPVGDIPWLVMLLLAGAYIMQVRRQSKKV